MEQLTINLKNLTFEELERLASLLEEMALDDQVHQIVDFTLAKRNDGYL